MVTRIFITGCAKSGTTLLKRLFYAFEDVEIIRQEIHIRSFVNLTSQASFLVGKRHRYSLYSEHMSEAMIESQRRIAEEHEVRIVNIIRDGRDVIHSSERYVEPRRWVEAMAQRDGLIAFELRYEDVVSQPDLKQMELASRFGLEIAHLWSSYPDFVPDIEFANRVYPRRPLDTNSVGVGDSYKGILQAVVEGFEQQLLEAGYR